MSLRYPRSLYLLALVELFERAAGVLLSLFLILYLTEQHGSSVAQATRQAGLFHALTYLLPLLGGLLADRLLGYRVVLLIGSMLLIAGYSILALGSSSFLYLALGLLILGQGFFRPTILVVVGDLYERADPRRDAGFGFFYAAANLGAALGPLLGSALKGSYGWTGTFLFAAGAMLACLVTLCVGWARLSGVNQRSRPAEHSAAEFRVAELSPVVLLLLVLVLFLVAYAQSASTLILFARDSTMRLVYGREVSVGMIAALPGGLVVLLSPCLALMMSSRRRRGGEPNTGVKMVVGLLVSGLAFLVLAGGAFLRRGEDKVPLAWLALGLLLLTLGELLVLPLGPSLLGELVPPSLSGLMTGLWYGAMALGFWVGGLVGVLYSRWSAAAFFGLCAGVLAVATVLMGWLARKLRQRHKTWGKLRVATAVAADSAPRTRARSERAGRRGVAGKLTPS